MVQRPLWALVAIRSSSGKKRLAGLLDDTQRRELVMAMAQDVLGALVATPAVDGVALTTADPALEALAQRLGVRLISEEGEGGLNAALGKARDVLVSAGAKSLLILHGDVPTVNPADIEALLAGHDGEVTIARAASDGGTNALLLTPPDAIALHFGNQSCSAHQAAAAAKGISAKVLAIAGLSHDIDQPEDLALLAASSATGKAAQFARELDGEGKRIGN